MVDGPIFIFLISLPQQFTDLKLTQAVYLPRPRYVLTSCTTSRQVSPTMATTTYRGDNYLPTMVTNVYLKARAEGGLHTVAVALYLYRKVARVRPSYMAGDHFTLCLYGNAVAHMMSCQNGLKFDFRLSRSVFRLYTRASAKHHHHVCSRTSLVH